MMAARTGEMAVHSGHKKDLDHEEMVEQVHHNPTHLHDQSSRTSLTLSDSWDWDKSDAHGVDVPALLQNLFDIDFLPFSTIPEEEDVPRSVEITEEDIVVCPEPPPEINVPPSGTDAESPVMSCHRVPAPTPDPEETKELQELILESTKKRRTGLRFKAAARAVFHRVKNGKKTPLRYNKRGPIKARELFVTEKIISTPSPTAALEIDHNSDYWISPTATAVTESSLSPASCNGNADGRGEAHYMIHSQTKCLRAQAEQQEKHVQETHTELEGLQSKLAATISRYQSQLEDLKSTQEQLAQLALDLSKAPAEEPKPEVPPQKEEHRRVLKRSESKSFMRVHDLSFDRSSSSEGSESVSSLSQSAHATTQLEVPTPEFLLMDQYLLEIVQQLTQLGFSLATDESERFTPTRDSARLLAQMPASARKAKNGWPIDPWTCAWDSHVLVWTGRVAHEGFGHTWPVVRGRAILHTSAKNVLNYLWDSRLVPKYNPMCEGRQDIYTLQDDVHVTARQSPYGFTGCAKIVQSINKHRLLPKAIEMKSLLYARPLEQHEGSYVLVSRSVWENNSATLDSRIAKNVIRTEMLLGCTIMRAIDDNTCETTQLTHVHSPVVPEMLAKRAAPGQCGSLMKALQSLFPPPPSSPR